MKKSQLKEQPQLEFDKTTAIPNNSGGMLFQQGFVLRKVSRFITGGDEDAVLPIPVFYDQETGKILSDTLPPELRSEYDTI